MPTVRTHIHDNTTADGDLAGTYPDPTVDFANDTIHVLKAGDTMGGSLLAGADSSYDMGSTTAFWRTVYTDKIQFSISSSATSAPHITTSGHTLILDLNRTADSNQRTFLIKNTGDGDPILAIQEGNGGNQIEIQHTGLKGQISSTFGNIQSLDDIEVPDEAYDATAWNGSTEVPTKNAVRDKIEAMGGATGTFTTADAKTVTVTNGVITAIV